MTSPHSSEPTGQEEELLLFGLNTGAGRLGTGTWENAYEPTTVMLEGNSGSEEWREGVKRTVKDVAIGRETIFVLTEEEDS